LVDVLIKTDRC